MVSTRSAARRPSPDPNRIIAVVTGANSGFGLGICQQLLRALSLPPGYPIPASTPQASATPISLRHLLPSPTRAHEKSKVIEGPPPTLTLILACRTQANGDETERILLERHEKELETRREAGLPVREGWRKGLRIVTETVDLDSPGGTNGILAFCARLRDTYPHVTTLFLNAGLGVFRGNDYWALFLQVMRDGPSWSFSRPTFNREIPGVMSADRERGLVWGVNVLATYILAKELEPMLRQSPSGLPFPPRVVYTSSSTASYAALRPDALDDHQLVSYASSYPPSKYLAELVTAQLDKGSGSDYPQSAKGAEGGPIRYLIAEPGAVVSNFFSKGFGPAGFYSSFMTFWYWVAFALVRLLFGSPYHPFDPADGALAMIYAALIDERFLLPASRVPAPRFIAHSHRVSPCTVDVGEIDRWEEAEEIGEKQVAACEAIRREWRRREGLESA